jgi:rhombotail lipoprotein
LGIEPPAAGVVFRLSIDGGHHFYVSRPSEIAIEARIAASKLAAMKLPRASHALLASLLVAVLLTSGCLGLTANRRTQRSSSVVSYLYPGKENPLAPTSIPVLRLPLRVGIAFVPPAGARSDSFGFNSGISEYQKMALMRRVADQFRGRDYIQSIEVVPSTYLRPGGGFENLEQIRRMLNIDVIALVAYDQVQFTNESFLSLAYWTIVGAYVVHGNKNDTQTMVEAAVYDIPSHHLLFRAPGVSQVKAGVAIINVDENLRNDSVKGIDQAMTELIANLKTELDGFRERVKQNPGEIQIERRPGYTGSGDFGPGFLAALALLAAGTWFRFRSRSFASIRG